MNMSSVKILANEYRKSIQKFNLLDILLVPEEMTETEKFNSRPNKNKPLLSGNHAKRNRCFAGSSTSPPIFSIEPLNDLT